MVDKKVEDLKKAFKDRKCAIEIHSNVIEIIFEKEEDADWFENIFEFLSERICCLLFDANTDQKMRPPKFIFNVKDIDKFIELVKKNIKS